MPLSREKREYVVRSVVRILKDVNRDEIIAALKEDVLGAGDEDGDVELDLVVLAVAEACRERLSTRARNEARAEDEDDG